MSKIQDEKEVAVEVYEMKINSKGMGKYSQAAKEDILSVHEYQNGFKTDKQTDGTDEYTGHIYTRAYSL